ncbi:MAG TPA: response regulator transcription factor [Phycisphaerales bacterium]|nr:response regulator transcription factor [Phycisphaerales bacterium]
MRILVIEDYPKLAQTIKKGLMAQGYAVDVCERGHEGEAQACSTNYDVIVLDLMLPDRDGLDVCRNLRRRKIATPILVLTALSRTSSKVDGLNAGADDYLCKPFEFDELLARIRALMRRHQGTESIVLRFDELELDLLKRSVTFFGERVKLSARELSLLELFMRNVDRVLSRTIIGEKVWDVNFESSSNVIDVYISSLRRKLAAINPRPLIHTVIGMGYRLGVPEEELVQQTR